MAEVKNNTYATYARNNVSSMSQNGNDGKMYCKHCGTLIDKDCVVCPHCGKQVAELTVAQPNIIINNSNSNINTNTNVTGGTVAGKPKNKWISLLLCIFTLFGHKFYEGKIGMGILYLLTGGLFGIGWVVDIIRLLFKPNPYYV